MKKYLLLLLVASSFTKAETFNVSTAQEFRSALTVAASNGQNDIIKVDAVNVSTQDDGLGGFIFQSEEDFSLTISGIENSVLDGNSSNPILYINTPGSATIDGVTFQNGYSESASGALTIDSGQQAFVTNSIFTNNITGDDGGAFKFIGDNYSVSNSTFSNNQATIHGGAIYSYDAKNIVIENSTFEGNTADVMGGAIMIHGNITSVVATIEDSIFKLNSASEGGAVSLSTHSSSDTYVINFIDNVFDSNTSAGRGGCIDTEKANIVRNDFKNCVSGTAGNSSHGQGGAIWGGAS